MKKFLSATFVSIFITSFFILLPDTSARSSGSYYRSAQSGQFTTKSYSTRNPSTTMKQSRR